MNHTDHNKHCMQSCIEACSHCHQVCLHTALGHCLNTGNKYVEAEHFRLMMSCAEICQASANFQLGDSVFHQRVCEVCAEICEACAVSCENVGGMDECVKACRDCAESCRHMASDKIEHHADCKHVEIINRAQP